MKFENMKLPPIIQGGMGAGVSDWKLARAVAVEGQLGIVSGTALDSILIRRLQLGDPDGNMRRAFDAFPFPAATDRILKHYFIPGGKAANAPFKLRPLVGSNQTRQVQELLVVANFVEVFLAKEGHDGMVGINFLEKIQSPLLASIYGAMLAGTDVIIVGAGIPRDIPVILDKLALNEAVEMTLYVGNASTGVTHHVSFDPTDLFDPLPAPLRRPLFFPIVASTTLANMMAKKAGGSIEGLIIEAPTAGGHNAPPRGRTQLNDSGEPIYGPRDEVDLEPIRALNLPFWLAGSCGSPEQLQHALAEGATGIQIGTLFAFCKESGIREDLKQNVVEMCSRGELRVFTDPVASPVRWDGDAPPKIRKTTSAKAANWKTPSAANAFATVCWRTLDWNRSWGTSRRNYRC